MDEVTECQLNRAIALSKQKADEEEYFEHLRLYFTSLFLQQPKMLGTLSFKEIVKKSAEFTREYIKYGN